MQVWLFNVAKQTKKLQAEISNENRQRSIDHSNNLEQERQRIKVKRINKVKTKITTRAHGLVNDRDNIN